MNDLQQCRNNKKSETKQLSFSLRKIRYTWPSAANKRSTNGTIEHITFKCRIYIVTTVTKHGIHDKICEPKKL